MEKKYIKHISTESLITKEGFINFVNNTIPQIDTYEDLRRKPSPELSEHLIHHVSEVGELYQSVKNKESKEVIFEEWADCILTDIKVGRTLGMTAEDMYQAVITKVNKIRERINK